jgi:hypothetical protein
MEYIGYHKNWVCDAPVLEELTSIARMPVMCLRNNKISYRIRIPLCEEGSDKYW